MIVDASKVASPRIVNNNHLCSTFDRGIRIVAASLIYRDIVSSPHIRVFLRLISLRSR